MKLKPLWRRNWEAGDAAQRKHFKRAEYTGTVQPPLEIGQWLLIAATVILMGVLLGRLLLSFSLPQVVRAPLQSKLPAQRAVPSGPALPPPFVPALAPSAAAQLAPGWPLAVSKWRPAIERVAAESGINPNLIAAIVLAESNGRPRVASASGAVGLMGIMAQGSGAGLGDRPQAQALQRPLLNLRSGAEILAGYLQYSEGNLRQALAIYNGGFLYAEWPTSQRYAEAILARYSAAIAAEYRLPDGNYRLVISTNPRARSAHLIYGGEQIELRGYLMPR